MDQHEKQKLRQDLEEEKRVLEEQLALIANKNPSVSGDYKAKLPHSDSSDTNDEKAHNVTDFEEERAVEQNFEMRLK
jgi:hypothetical protein